MNYLWVAIPAVLIVLGTVVWIWARKDSRRIVVGGGLARPLPRGVLQVGHELLDVGGVELTDGVIRIHASGLASLGYAAGENMGPVQIHGDDRKYIASYDDVVTHSDIEAGDMLHMKYDVKLQETDEFQRWVLAPPQVKGMS